MSSSDIISGIALLVSIASFAYGVRSTRHEKQLLLIEKRVGLLSKVSEFIMMQERITIEASRLSQAGLEDHEAFSRIVSDKQRMAEEMRELYKNLETLSSMNVEYLSRLESRINNMLHSARVSLEGLLALTNGYT